jgi:acyl-CoA thioesterase-2
VAHDLLPTRLMNTEYDASPLTWDGADAAALMSLERLDANLFRNRYNQINLNGALYGGQVFGQALAAAAATIEGRDVHSCHGYFLRSGNADRRIIFEVENTRDGGSFSSRRVVALQNGVPILHLECSFHVCREGFDHQSEMPAVPEPEALEDLQTILKSGAPDVPPFLVGQFAGHYPIEIRPVRREGLFAVTAEARRQCWRICRISGSRARA